MVNSRVNGPNHAKLKIGRRLQVAQGHYATCIPRQRHLHSSSSRRSHYDTLSIPKHASRSQVKSSFYKLSKIYHPDVTKDPGAKDKFQKVSEAYAVLGDERKRRAYDRTLVSADTGRHRHPTPASAYPGAPSSSHWAYGHEHGPRKRPGATHAWNRHDAPGRGPYWQGYPRSSPYTHPQAAPERHQDPFNSLHVRRATGHNPSKDPLGPSEADTMNRVSSLWRAVQVIGIVMFVATVGGGFRASA
ncbi:DnaJ-domain-containing protein [Trametopsis cervina]|nr:DnaJ-domain-containing protein [Trametopsis cervina]